MGYEKDSAIVVLYGSKEFKELDKTLTGQLSKACELNNFDKDTAEVEISYPSKTDFNFITVFKTDAKSSTEWRNIGGKYFTKYNGKVKHLYFTKHPNSADVDEGAELATYSFDEYKTDIDLDDGTFLHPLTDGSKSLHKGTFFARDLITEPGNVLYPAEYANRLTKTLTPKGVTVKVYHETQLEEMGLNLLLSVGQGSRKDSYVVVMEWMNGGKEKPIALVGKGVTFDTGGISIKPSPGMGDMKYDMGGSAAVVGAMYEIADKKVKKNVVGIVGLVENMPDGNAIKPGDIVTSLNGMTVENLNTDAEGRLVLADILTYVQNEYDPSLVVDLATLTGAILVALGNEAAGLFTNSSELANTIDTVGSKSGEGFWRMPMGKNWNKMIDSSIADVKNIGGGRNGGSTTAAEFLYRFVDKDRAWAHLDIAGMCWADSAKDTVPQGAVGFGVRTLFNLVQENGNYEIDEDMEY